MIVNGNALIEAKPIKDMIRTKEKAHGVSHGLSEVGYDLRVKQEIRWYPPDPMKMINLVRNEQTYSHSYFKDALDKAFFGFTEVIDSNDNITRSIGRTALASSVEEWHIPNHLWGELRNKSTHARKFTDFTIGTDMEPGWKGHLTIEIIFHANEPLIIPAGSGVAKAVFHELTELREYDGKYQNQANRPVESIYK